MRRGGCEEGGDRRRLCEGARGGSIICLGCAILLAVSMVTIY